MNALDTTMPLSGTPIADGDAGTEQTVHAMQALIEQGKKHPVIHELTAAIMQDAHVPAFDFRREACAAFNWVVANIPFRRDVADNETLHAPWETIRLHRADCDDFTILLCSMLENLGASTRIVTVAAQPAAPDQFSHVFPEVEINGKWIPVDAGRKHPVFGQGVRGWFRRVEWPSTPNGGGHTAVSGLAGIGAYLPRTYVPPNVRPAQGSSAPRLSFVPPAARMRPDLSAVYSPRPKAQPWIGVGNYLRPGGGKNGLGQTTDDAAQILTSIAQDIAAGGQAATGIISSTAQLTAVQNQGQYASTAASIQAQELATEQAQAAAAAAANPLSALTSNPLLLLLLAGGAIFLIMRSKS